MAHSFSKVLPEELAHAPASIWSASEGWRFVPPRCRAIGPRVLWVSHYQSTLAVYVYVVPWSEFPIIPSYPHYPQGGGFVNDPQVDKSACSLLPHLAQVRLLCDEQLTNRSLNE